jgi:hypothetical protein
MEGIGHTLRRDAIGDPFPWVGFLGDFRFILCLSGLPEQFPLLICLRN